MQTEKQISAFFFNNIYSLVFSHINLIMEVIRLKPFFVAREQTFICFKPSPSLFYDHRCIALTVSLKLLSLMDVSTRVI